MVVFVCSGCGESLRKNKVDQHMSSCRSGVSCVDCGKEFGRDYSSHTQCVSEDQKYGGLDYQPKANTNKGQQKQEEWIEKIKIAIAESTANTHIKGLMQRLVTYTNIPRKEKPFFNFIKNSLRVNNTYYIQQLWDIFRKALDLKQTNQNTNGNHSQRDDNKRGLVETEVTESSSSKKLKASDDNEEESSQLTEDNVTNGVKDETDLESNTKLNMNKVIVKILKESESKELSLKKLQKKVLKMYKTNEDNYDKQRVINRFDKKLSSNKKVSVNEGIVSLN